MAARHRAVRACPECGALNAAEAARCRRCGAGLERAEAFHVPAHELREDVDAPPHDRRGDDAPGYERRAPRRAGGSEYRRKARTLDGTFFVAALVLTVLGAFQLAVVVLAVGVLAVFKPWRRR